MTLKSYLLSMSLATGVCWGLFFYVIAMIDPEKTNWIGFFLFYLTLFFSLVGLIALIGFIIRFIALKRELAFRAVKEAFRQSFLFAFFVVAILFLLSQDYFNWLNVVFLIIGLSVLEFFLISYNK